MHLAFAASGVALSRAGRPGLSCVHPRGGRTSVQPLMVLGGLPKTGGPRSSILIAAFALAAVFGTQPVAFDVGKHAESRSPVRGIQNQALRYGNYCGPGPQGVCTEEGGCHALPGLPPVDEIDETCLLHDISYDKCKGDLKARGITPLPGMHLLMAVRGALPGPIAEMLISVDKTYSMCMAEADSRLVSDFQRRIDGALLPRWWDEPRLAPEGTEGTEGFEVACAVALPGTKVCLAESKFVFKGFTNLFHEDLAVDERVRSRQMVEPGAELANGLGRAGLRDAVLGVVGQ